MGSVVALCVAFAVAGSLLTVLFYGAFFVLAALSAARARRRPDPITVSLDRLLVDVLGEEAAGARPPGRTRGVGEREQ